VNVTPLTSEVFNCLERRPVRFRPYASIGRVDCGDYFYHSSKISILPEHLQVRGLAEIWRVLKTGGRLLIADMTHSSTSLHMRGFAALSMQRGHGAQFGIEDPPELLKEAGFEEIKQLGDQFLTIGFVRASKPAA
jgi:SAM-dependent methyltransferase